MLNTYPEPSFLCIVYFDEASPGEANRSGKVKIIKSNFLLVMLIFYDDNRHIVTPGVPNHNLFIGGETIKISVIWTFFFFDLTDVILSVSTN